MQDHIAYQGDFDGLVSVRVEVTDEPMPLWVAEHTDFWPAVPGGKPRRETQVVVFVPRQVPSAPPGSEAAPMLVDHVDAQGKPVLRVEE
jgi:hypothetical protein